jgi:hypothetical protein
MKRQRVRTPQPHSPQVFSALLKVCMQLLQSVCLLCLRFAGVMQLQYIVDAVLV